MYNTDTHRHVYYDVTQDTHVSGNHEITPSGLTKVDTSEAKFNQPAAQTLISQKVFFYNHIDNHGGHSGGHQILQVFQAVQAASTGPRSITDANKND